MKLTLGGICKSGESWDNHTGSWRTFRPVVNEDKCIGCKICETYCPDGAMDIVDRLAVVDLDFCKGCGICEKECPQDAIEMKQEGGEN